MKLICDCGHEGEIITEEEEDGLLVKVGIKGFKRIMGGWYLMCEECGRVYDI